MGKYKRVCFQTSGQTQFFPYGDAVPSIGVVDRLEVVGEVKVETMCVGRDVMLKSVAALKEYVRSPSFPIFFIGRNFGWLNSRRGCCAKPLSWSMMRDGRLTSLSPAIWPLQSASV